VDAAEVRENGLAQGRCWWLARLVITDEALGRILRQRWGLPEGTQVARHDGGMVSVAVEKYPQVDRLRSPVLAS
jgi:hypothetical protein